MSLHSPVLRRERFPALVALGLSLLVLGALVAPTLMGSGRPAGPPPLPIASFVPPGRVDEARADASNTGRRVIVEGVLNIVHTCFIDCADCPTGKRHGTDAYFLDTGQDTPIPIEMNPMLVDRMGGPGQVFGRRFQIAGVLRPGANVPDRKVASYLGPGFSGLSVWADDMRLAPTQTGSIEEWQRGRTRTQAGATPLKYVVIPVRFSDTVNTTPHPKEYYEQLFGQGANSMGDFWLRNSLGSMTIDGTIVTDYVNLPEPASAYGLPGTIAFQKVAEQATAAVDAQVDFSEVYGINIMINIPSGGGAWGWGGGVNLARDGGSRFFGCTWNHPNHDHFLLGHEMGHSLGMPHSGTYDEYDSQWDMMSYGFWTQSGTGFGLMSNGTLSSHRMTMTHPRLAWIPEPRIVRVPRNRVASVNLERILDPVSATNPVAIVLATPNPNVWFTVESRKDVAYDVVRGARPGFNNGIPSEGVVVTRVTNGRSRPIDTDGDGDVNDDGGWLAVGEQFVDSATNIKVRVENSGPTHFRVFVANDANNTPPQITLPQINPVNELSRLSFPAVNSDEQGNEVAWSLAPGAPAGATINATSGVFNWTPSEAQGPGTYTVTIIATETNGDPNDLSGEATFNVEVREVNARPVLPTLTDVTIKPNVKWTRRVTATDSDIPVNTLTYSFVGLVPTGMTISPTTGNIQWLPNASQLGRYPITVRVQDNGSPTLAAQSTFNVAVDTILHTFAVSPTAVMGGVQTAVGTVTLDSPSPAGGTQIGLQSTDATLISIPTKVTVPAGQTRATFTVTPRQTFTPRTVQIRTTRNHSIVSAAFTVNPVNMGTVTVSPTVIIGGRTATGTVTLPTNAGLGGISVSLSDNSAFATTPASVTVPQGQRSANFTVTTSRVSNEVPVTVSAGAGGTTASTLLRLIPEVTVRSIVVNPTTVAGGQRSTATVTLNAPAPTGGVTVLLSEDTSATSVPPSLLIPAGQSVGSFQVTTTPVTRLVAARIAARAGTREVATTLRVAPWMASFTVAPVSVRGGQSATATVNLSVPAPTGGLTVTLSDNSAVVNTPLRIVVPAGQTRGTATLRTTPVTTAVRATVTATVGAHRLTDTLDVFP